MKRKNDDHIKTVFSPLNMNKNFFSFIFELFFTIRDLLLIHTTLSVLKGQMCTYNGVPIEGKRWKKSKETTKMKMKVKKEQTQGHQQQDK